jgi:replicative DNA helicase
VTVALLPDGQSGAEEYEAVLIGLVLAGYPDIPLLTRIIGSSEAAFYSPILGGAWEAIIRVHKQGLRPEPLIVKDQMVKDGVRFDPGYLHTLVHQVGTLTVETAPHYAERVRETHQLRQIMTIGTRMVQAGSGVDADPRMILNYVSGWVGDLLGAESGDVSDTWQVLEQAIVDPGTGDPDRMPTPWPGLSTIIGGTYPGQVVVIAGRPGRGKSIMLENWSTELARRDGCQTLYISMEMQAKELMQRTLAWTARVELTKIRTGQYNDIEALRLAEAATKIAETPAEIIDKGHVTVDDIRAYGWSAKQRATRAGRRLVVIAIDYAGLVVLNESRNTTRQQQIGEMTRALKRLAKELEVTIFIGVQLSRGVEGRRDSTPMLSDLREAGDFEQDADVVILIHPEQIVDQGRVLNTDAAELIVAKDRNGPLGSTFVQMHGAYTRFWES